MSTMPPARRCRRHWSAARASAHPNITLMRGSWSPSTSSPRAMASIIRAMAMSGASMRFNRADRQRRCIRLTRDHPGHAAGRGAPISSRRRPRGATGDGIAMAWRAGCRVSNMEMMQFHPTCLYNLEVEELPDHRGDARRGRQAEAAPGDARRRHALHGPVRPSAASWPRAISWPAPSTTRSSASASTMSISTSATRAPEFIKEHFPTIHARLLDLGIDITQGADPGRAGRSIIPAAAWSIDLDGRTDLPGLYAAGEVTAVGPARRQSPRVQLAARMLRVRRGRCQSYPRQLGRRCPPPPTIRPWDESRVTDPDEEVIVQHNWNEIRRFMWDYVGIVRTTKRLERAQHRIDLLRARGRRLLRQFPRDAAT